MASKALIAARIEARRNIVPLTAEDILTVNRNDLLYRYFHENVTHRPDGTCYEWRPNGRIQLWKTRPTQFRLPIKYGLRGTAQMRDSNVGDFHYASECPVAQLNHLADSRE